MLHIFGSSVVEGYREVVCIADGERMEANSALICAAPEMAAAVLAGDLDAARATLADRGLA